MYSNFLINEKYFYTVFSIHHKGVLNFLICLRNIYTDTYTGKGIYTNIVYPQQIKEIF